MTKTKKLKQCEDRYALAWASLQSMVGTIRACQTDPTRPDKMLIRQVEDTMHSVVLKGIADEYEQLGGVVYRYAVNSTSYAYVSPRDAKVRAVICAVTNESSVTFNHEHPAVVDHTVAFATTEKLAKGFITALSFAMAVELHKPPEQVFGWFFVDDLVPVRLSTLLYGKWMRNRLHIDNLPLPNIPLRNILDGSYTDFFL